VEELLPLVVGAEEAWLEEVELEVLLGAELEC
jgi:hypothetical protein